MDNDIKRCYFSQHDIDTLPLHLKAMRTAATTAEARKARISKYATDEQRAAEEKDIDQAAYDTIHEHRAECERLLKDLRELHDEKARRARNLCEPKTAQEWDTYYHLRESYKERTRRLQPTEALPEYNAALNGIAKYAILDTARAMVDAMMDMDGLADDASLRQRLSRWQIAVKKMEAIHYRAAAEVEANNQAAITGFSRMLDQQFGAVEEQRHRLDMEQRFGIRHYPDQPDSPGFDPEPRGGTSAFVERAEPMTPKKK